MDRISAVVENIIYYNEDNHYAVLEVSDDNGLFTAVGHFPYIRAGEYLEAEGNHTRHPVYGEQFSVQSYQIVAPKGTEAIERYLAGGAVKGIGPSLARRIVKKFKGDTFRIMEEEPERLAEVKGISLHMAMLISERMELKKDMREALLYLQELGITGLMAMRVYEKYGPSLYAVLQKNPYRLADEMEGIGFRTADGIAMRAGIPKDSPFRIRSGILYTLQEAMAAGHTRLPREKLEAAAAELLELKPEDAAACLMDLQVEGRIMMSGPGGSFAAPASAYYAEHNTALMLRGLNIRVPAEERVRNRLKKIVSEAGIEQDEKQLEAAAAAAENGFLIITGGPGTGKTTLIRILIRYFEEEGLSVMLASPTGRAAKRMTEAAGREAKTIHRMLEYTGVPGADNADGGQVSGAGVTERYGGSGNGGGSGSTTGKGRFLRDERDPLEADVLIVDEASMIDIFLMEALLRAVVPGTRLILVGDASQLPSVGPGNVLKDLIAFEAFRTVRLERIFRQAEASDIIVNAHRINRGEPVDLAKKSRDFLFIRRSDPAGILKDIRVLLTEKLPSYLNCSPEEIQLLTPTRKGELGVEQLNTALQEILNPAAPGKPELRAGKTVFRLGDKVMQIRNDYSLEWERRDEYGLACEKGSGIFNGDMGIVTQIDKDADLLAVLYDDERLVFYDRRQLEELEMAYAVTVHKSQGSEYPAVIMPMYYGPAMLMNRNLLYTAVTRAKSCVCLLGLPEVFEKMEKNDQVHLRYTGLPEALAEVFPGQGPAPQEEGGSLQEDLDEMLSGL